MKEKYLQCFKIRLDNLDGAQLFLFNSEFHDLQSDKRNKEAPVIC